MMRLEHSSAQSNRIPLILWIFFLGAMNWMSFIVLSRIDSLCRVVPQLLIQSQILLKKVQDQIGKNINPFRAYIASEQCSNFIPANIISIRKRVKILFTGPNMQSQGKDMNLDYARVWLLVNVENISSWNSHESRWCQWFLLSLSGPGFLRSPERQELGSGRNLVREWPLHPWTSHMNWKTESAKWGPIKYVNDWNS